MIPLLTARGHQVTALVREQSKARLPSGCEAAIGNALDGDSYAGRIGAADTFIHLIGVSHPSPAKAAQFVEIDLRSAHEAIRVAAAAGVQHFIYLSVAHPAPVMHAYIEARCAAEQTLRESGLHATILRPWYVLGPGHRWPYLLLPFYAAAKLFPATRQSAERLTPVKLRNVLHTVVRAVEQPARGIRIFETQEMRIAR